jgi:hypothetical protein
MGCHRFLTIDDLSRLAKIKLDKGFKRFVRQFSRQGSGSALD